MQMLLCRRTRLLEFAYFFSRPAAAPRHPAIARSRFFLPCYL